METKYYTPEIEEFHVGFEFEFFNNKGKIFFVTEKENEWIKTNMPYTGILSEPNNLRKLILDNQVRTKHLDREDIESLGWSEEGLSYFTNGNFVISLKQESIYIYNEKNIFLFQGNIKNKSELKTLLKQLNIE